MEDVVRLSFACARAIAAMEPALAGVPGVQWQILGGADGDYLRGLTPNGVKIRLVPRAARFGAEIFFPIGPGWTRFTDEQKRAFVEWTKTQLLAAIAASDVRDEA
ncbi:MAG TPA: hypothetical protein VMV18_02515 [bacterium]|nr:hypothetical protein [bacterium]